MISFFFILYLCGRFFFLYSLRLFFTFRPPFSCALNHRVSSISDAFLALIIYLSRIQLGILKSLDLMGSRRAPPTVFIKAEMAQFYSESLLLSFQQYWSCYAT